MTSPTTPATPGAAAFLEKFKDPLNALLTNEVCGDVDQEKVLQLAEARRNHLYFLGMQYLIPHLDGGGSIDWKPVKNYLRPTAGQCDDVYDYVLNMFAGDVAKFVGVIGVRSPNVKGQPNRQGSDDLTRRAQIADKVASQLRSGWQVDELQPILSLALCLYGTQFFYTPYVSNPDLFGYTEEPEYAVRERLDGPPYYQCSNCGSRTPVAKAGIPPMCPECGTRLTPVDYREPEMISGLEMVGSKRYANGSVELHVCDCFTVTTPFYAKKVSECPWLWYEYEESKGKLLRAYPELRGKVPQDYATGDSTNASSEYSRSLSSSAMGIVPMKRKNRWTFSRFWLDPSMYEYLDHTGTDGELRDLMRSQYPQGCKITKVQGVLADIEREALHRVWAACKPNAWPYLYPQPLFNNYIQMQDLTNDYVNMLWDWTERSAPVNLFDPQMLDRNVVQEQMREPQEFIPVKPGWGKSIGDGLFRVQGSAPDPESGNFVELVMSKTRENQGIQPAIYGGGQASQTARSDEIRRNQALAQLNIPWNQIRFGWKDAYENGALQLAEHSNGKVYSSKGTPETVEEIEIPGIDELLKGGWHYDMEESIPMTAGQRRDTVANMLTMPQAWQMLGMGTPDNLEQIQEDIGMPDWKVPGMDQRDRLLQLIEKLLQSGSVQQPDGSSAPSIPINTFTFEPPFVVQVIKSWLQSERGAEEEDRNPEGYANVLAYGQAYLDAMAPPPPPPPVPPPNPLKESFAVTAKYEDLSPEVQAAVLNKAQISSEGPGPQAPPDNGGPPPAAGAPGEAPPPAGPSGPPPPIQAGINAKPAPGVAAPPPGLRPGTAPAPLAAPRPPRSSLLGPAVQ